MNQPLVITGHRGFLGSILARDLSSQGADIIPCPVDITQKTELANWSKTLPQRFQVLHLAGMSFVPDCDRDPDKARKINVDGAANVFESVVAKSSRFIFASSGQIYHPEDSIALREDSRLAPINLYAETKLAAEENLKQLADAQGKSLVILRLFNFTHKSQKTPSFLPRIYRAILELKSRGQPNAELKVGNIDLSRDLSPVQDFIAAMKLLLNTPTDGINLYNLGSGSGKNLRVTLKFLFDQVGVHPQLVTDPSLVRTEPKSIVSNNEKFKNRFGWHPIGIAEESLVKNFLAEL